MLFIDEMINKKLIKLSAYDTLLNLNVTKLPVEPYDLLKDRTDVDIFDFTFFEKFDFGREECKIAYGEFGCVLRSDKHNKYFVHYNAENPDQLIRWTLSCLLAAIELHVVSDGIYYSLVYNDKSDPEMFAYNFTAPDIILKSTGAIAPEAIIRNCGIPFDKARKKSRNLLFSYGISQIEKVLKYNFMDYIIEFNHSE